ncbi:MAG: histone deacetylase [Verrucomicrobiae bacterium]|nr:histone deacetylase [Verrucomicrobiae bacterium]
MPVSPVALTEVLLPRSGHPVYGKVAIVYAKDYRIGAGRMERLHAFDMRKNERIYRALVDRNMFAPGDVFVPDEISRKQLLRVHTSEYLDSLEDPQVVAMCLEAPSAASLTADDLESKVLRPFRLASGGTLLAAREALKFGIGINIGGGYLHAKPSSGEAFCIYADVPVAIRQLQKEGRIRKALVIDLNAHQGHGTITCLRNDPDTYTFSMHEADIYPIPKAVGDQDVALPAGIDDEAYMNLLSQQLPLAFERFGAPDIVFYVAGCDSAKGDSLAHLSMTHAGIVERDRMVINTCREKEVPVVMTLGSGFGRDAWRAQYLSIRQIISSQRE